MDKKLIISRIDELMQEKGITKYQLKENAEVSSTIYQWRKNAARDKDRTPSLRSIEKICDFLGVSLAYFFLLIWMREKLYPTKNFTIQYVSWI